MPAEPNNLYYLDDYRCPHGRPRGRNCGDCDPAFRAARGVVFGLIIVIGAALAIAVIVATIAVLAIF